MAKVSEMQKGKIIFLKKPFGKYLSGWCVIKAVDLRDKTATIWYVGQDYIEKYSTVPFYLFRAATNEEALVYVTRIFHFDPLTAVVVAHDNDLTESLAQSLTQVGLTRAKAEDMPSFQSVTRVLQDTMLFQTFLEIVEQMSTREGKHEEE